MSRARRRARDFLRRHGMDARSIDIEAVVRTFREEMERGLAGRESSLKMIPTYLEVDRDVPAGKPVIALDAGGTHFRVATVTFDREGRPALDRFQVHPMPGSAGRVTKREFFQLIARYIRPAAADSPTIGFCFSYPTEMRSDHDGRLMHLTKELQVEGLPGELIGENLLAALEEQAGGPAARGVSDRSRVRKVVLLNDTVATLLAGTTAAPRNAFGGYGGFILGTGTNCAYIERNRFITKTPGLAPARSQIINVESGGFAGAPRGDIDLALDRCTANPGEHTFEKMISGAYFGELVGRTIEEAAREGLFSAGWPKGEAGGMQKPEASEGDARRAETAGFCQAEPCGTGAPLSGSAGGRSGVEAGAAGFLRPGGGLSSREVGEFCRNPGRATGPLAEAAAAATGEDRRTLVHLIDGLVERAAKLTAINISSMALRSGGGRDPCRPFCVTAEGSFLYGMRYMKPRVESYLKGYLTDRKGRYVELIGIENAPLIGAAIAGLIH